MKKLGVRGYKKLVVWQKAHSFTKDLIKIVRLFPNNQEAKIFQRQIIRAVSSIPANIAEGYGGFGSINSYRNYLVIAKRSTYEVDYWLLLVHELDYLSLEQYTVFADQLSEITAMLIALIKSLKGAPPASGLLPPAP